MDSTTRVTRGLPLLFPIIAIALLAGIGFWQWPWTPSTPVGAADEEHDHSAEVGASDPNVIELSPQARQNLGLDASGLAAVRLSGYQRSLSVPGVVIARPGRTLIGVSSPLNGVITHVHAVPGEAVTPGALLFEIRLSYEDLVESQTAFLRTKGELQVESREIARLEGITQSGAVSGKSLLERRYNFDRLEAQLHSQRQGLRLHGLSDVQIDTISEQGKLLRDLQIVAPDIDVHSDEESTPLLLTQTPAQPVGYRREPQPFDATASADSDRPLMIEELSVYKGKSVAAGTSLCSLADCSNLFIECHAFEQDSAAISQVIERNWNVDAVFPTLDGEEVVAGLPLDFVGSSMNRSTRTLPFYVSLPNKVVRDQTNNEGQRFISWKYRPGQRLQVRIPVEEWIDQIVVPIDAVVSEGAEWYVFKRVNTRSFRKTPVHLKYRDQNSAILAAGDSLLVGDIIALRSANQMLMALKQRSAPAAAAHTH